MIYLDTSVALAHLLGEDRQLRPELWRESLVSSRLLVYELWTQVHARKLAEAYSPFVQALLEPIALLELSPTVVERALDPFPLSLRTLDTLHLASALYLVKRGEELSLATFDVRMARAATLLGIRLFDV